MAGPITIGAALSHVVSLTCPHCGLRKAVVERRAAARLCPRCGQVIAAKREPGHAMPPRRARRDD